MSPEMIEFVLKEMFMDLSVNHKVKIFVDEYIDVISITILVKINGEKHSLSYRLDRIYESYRIEDIALKMLIEIKRKISEKNMTFEYSERY